MDKSLLRRQLLCRRKCVENRAEKDACIGEKIVQFAQDFDTVLLYASMGSEVSTHRVFERLQEKKVYLPFTTSDGQVHAALPRRPVDWSRVDAWGNVDVYTDCFYDGQADLTIVPLMGFTSDNYRIGYGKGCYDKYFATHANGLRVGLAYEEQFCTFVPEATDVPLDYIITPERVIRREK